MKSRPAGGCQRCIVVSPEPAFNLTRWEQLDAAMTTGLAGRLGAATGQTLPEPWGSL